MFQNKAITLVVKEKTKKENASINMYQLNWKGKATQEVWNYYPKFGTSKPSNSITTTMIRSMWTLVLEKNQN